MKLTDLREIFEVFTSINNRIPEVEQNIVLDNDYYKEKLFNKPRKYDNLYNFIHNRTIISNKSNKNILINTARFYINCLKKYEYEEIIFNYGLNEQSSIIYAVNNGNLASTKKYVTIETYAYLEGGNKKFIQSFNTEFQLLDGEIKCVLEEKLESEMKKIFMRNNNYIGLFHKIIVNNVSTECMVCYFIRETGLFCYGGMGGGSSLPRINLIELDVSDYRELYVFNNLNLEISINQMKEIDIHVLPNESCQIDYSIEYYYHNKKIKYSDKCVESTIVKVPQFKLNPASSVQFHGFLFDVLVKDNIKRYQKGELFHIDKQICANFNDLKKDFIITEIGYEDD